MACAFQSGTASVYLEIQWWFLKAPEQTDNEEDVGAREVTRDLLFTLLLPLHPYARTPPSSPPSVSRAVTFEALTSIRALTHKVIMMGCCQTHSQLSFKLFLKGSNALWPSHFWIFIIVISGAAVLSVLSYLYFPLLFVDWLLQFWRKCNAWIFKEMVDMTIIGCWVEKKELILNMNHIINYVNTPGYSGVATKWLKQ